MCALAYMTLVFMYFCFFVCFGLTIDLIFKIIFVVVLSEYIYAICFVAYLIY